MLKRFPILRLFTYALLTALVVRTGVLAQETCDVPLLVSACADSAHSGTRRVALTLAKRRGR